MVSPEDVIVTDKFTGEVLSEHLIEPTKRYWAKKRLGKIRSVSDSNYAVFVNDVLRHHSAVTVGFEPTVDSHPHNFSRVAP